MAQSAQSLVRAAKSASLGARSKVRRAFASVQANELARRPLASIQANELSRRRVRAYQIFSSPEQPPEPSLPLRADTSDLPYNWGEVTSQSWYVLESWNSEIDRLGHPLPKIGNHHVWFCAQGLDNRCPGKAPGAIGTIEQ